MVWTSTSSRYSVQCSSLTCSIHFANAIWAVVCSWWTGWSCMWHFAFDILARYLRCLLSCSRLWDHHHFANGDGLDFGMISWIVSVIASFSRLSRCSATTFPDRTTPLLTSHATFLQVSSPYPSIPTSIQPDLRPSTMILYPLSRIRIPTAHILCILCPILVHVCLGLSVSFSPSFPYCFPLLYL
jgi:hypothetical protein